VRGEDCGAPPLPSQSILYQHQPSRQRINLITVMPRPLQPLKLRLIPVSDELAIHAAVNVAGPDDLQPVLRNKLALVLQLAH
jgi:hypothetical protein